jgi:hypothetical protein
MKNYKGSHLKQEERQRMLTAETEEEAVRLDYEIQLAEHRLQENEREIQAVGGVMSARLNQANRTKGHLIYLLGFFVIGVHIALNLWAVEWLEMGWKGTAMAAGLSVSGAVGAAFMFTGLMRIFKRHELDGYTVLLTFVAASILLASMGTSAFLGKVRAERVRMETTEVSQAVILEGKQVQVSEQTSAVEKFYGKVMPLLCLLFPLASILLDLSSGLLLHVGFDKVSTSGVCLKLLRERERLNERKVKETFLRDSVGQRKERESLEKEDCNRKQEEDSIRRSTPEYKAKRIAVALIIFMLGLAALLVFATAAWSDTVVGIDLSLSGKNPGVSGRDPLGMNVKAAGEIIQTIGPGETFRVLGITAKSRADPFQIMSARLSENPGHFGERLARERAVVRASWLKTSEKLQLFAKETDIIGFLFLAGELLEGSEQKAVYVLSDGKNCTRELDIEKAPESEAEFLEKLNRLEDFPDLQGARVFFLGAGGPGTSTIHLKALELFWKGFVEKSGGTLERFSTMREVRR